MDTNTLNHHSKLVVRRSHDVLFATLNIPATRNALAPDLVAEIARVVTLTETDSSVRALVLRGGGGFFCAGGNVGNFQQRLHGDVSEGDPIARRNREFGHCMQRLAALPVPVIAAVEGAAIGGGMGLACAADIVLATSDARFSLPETSLGIIPAQIAPFVVARIGARAACRLGLSGERVSGELALQLGLVDALSPDSAGLDASLANWLTRICACGPQANRLLKPLFRRCGKEPEGDLLDDAAKLFARCMREEGVHGVEAFRAGQPASWCRTFSVEDIRAAQAVG
jgi:isohexenylglutaconyl-CoA hydratase